MNFIAIFIGDLLIMSERDTNLDVANEIYRNASVALLAISNVLEDVCDAGLKKEITRQYEGYEKFIGEISAYMLEKGYEKKEVGVFKKFSMSSGIKMNTFMDDSKSHIAQIMIKGTVMGITELCTLLNDKQIIKDTALIEFAQKLKTLEEDYEQALKKFL